MKNHREIIKRELLKFCKTCMSGSCCKDGVNVDSEEAKKISGYDINLRRPWFKNLFQDSDMPSGWAVSTVKRNGRCVFQRTDRKCIIYKYRPRFCRDFPLENEQIAKFYYYLCEKPPRLKLKIKRDFISHYPKSRIESLKRT